MRRRRRSVAGWTWRRERALMDHHRRSTRAYGFRGSAKIGGRRGSPAGIAHGRLPRPGLPVHRQCSRSVAVVPRRSSRPVRTRAVADRRRRHARLARVPRHVSTAAGQVTMRRTVGQYALRNRARPQGRGPRAHPAPKVFKRAAVDAHSDPRVDAALSVVARRETPRGDGGGKPPPRSRDQRREA